MEADRGTPLVVGSKSVVLLLAASSVSLVLGWLVLFWDWPHWHWEDLPVHSAVEAVGAVAALFMALMLLGQWQPDRGQMKTLLGAAAFSGWAFWTAFTR